jgi:hypothetical protein
MMPGRMSSAINEKSVGRTFGEGRERAIKRTPHLDGEADAVKMGILDISHSASRRIARQNQVLGPFLAVAERCNARAIELAVNLMVQEVGDEELLLIPELAEDLGVGRGRASEIVGEPEDDENWD